MNKCFYLCLAHSAEGFAQLKNRWHLLITWCKQAFSWSFNKRQYIHVFFITTKL